MTTKEAVNAIVTYHTLPQQIDYRLPWKIKAYKAEAYIKSLPEAEQSVCNNEIRERVDAYYEPIGDGPSAAELNDMF